jgi:hypothetical protein
MDISHKAKILQKYAILYFHCPQCQFIQTEHEFWLDEAYIESINYSDTGYISRNILLSKVTTSILGLFFSSSAKCLDYAGGYGVFVRLMRDIGYDFYWQDKFTKNLFAKGFNVTLKNKYDLITSFESFEHFDNPLQEIGSMLEYSDSILFSTVLYGDHVPSSSWGYYGLEHGQHIAFYNLVTLNKLANKLQLNFYSDRKSIHLFTKRKINPFIFFIVAKIARFGLGSSLALLKKSKTFADWELMRKLHQ